MTDRRRERLLPARWPGEAEAAASRWFSPVALGPLQAATRTWVPAMVPWRATDEGLVTQEVVDWYTRFARGRPGVLVVEATGVRDVPSGPLLRAGHERFVPGLARLAAAVREASGGQTRLFLQLIDFLVIRRRPSVEAFLGRFLAIDEPLRERLGPGWGTRPEAEVRDHLATLPQEALEAVLDERAREALRFGHRERVTDPQLAGLPTLLPELFARAAERCARAGFDGVELHAAHAYTLASFLSARNTRADGYGGPREHRVRLPLEVYRAVRQAVPTSVVVGTRFLADEVIEGGSSPEDIDFFACAFADAGLDYLSLSRGGKFEDARQPRVGHAAYPYTGRSGHECMPTSLIPGGPWGRNRAAVARIKRALVAAGHSTPVVLCGGIATFEQAEDVLRAGEADVVASARQTLADPDWFQKVREGRGEHVRRCLFTNYCEGLDQAHQVVTCQLWDRVRGLPDDHTVRRTADGRRTVAP